MTVSDPNVIDIVGVDRQTGEVVLTLCDHLHWEESDSHLVVLQEKLNRYLACVESGELANRFPAGSNRPVRIEIAFKFQPPTAAEEFLSQAEHIVSQAGFKLCWRHSTARNSEPADR